MDCLFSLSILYVCSLGRPTADDHEEMAASQVTGFVIREEWQTKQAALKQQKEAHDLLVERESLMPLA